MDKKVATKSGSKSTVVERYVNNVTKNIIADAIDDYYFSDVIADAIYDANISDDLSKKITETNVLIALKKNKNIKTSIDKMLKTIAIEIVSSTENCYCDLLQNRKYDEMTRLADEKAKAAQIKAEKEAKEHKRKLEAEKKQKAVISASFKNSLSQNQQQQYKFLYGDK